MLSAIHFIHIRTMKYKELKLLIQSDMGRKRDSSYIQTISVSLRAFNRAPSSREANRHLRVDINVS